MNNKGFAISSLIYTSIILLSTIIFTTIAIESNKYENDKTYLDEVRSDLSSVLKNEIPKEETPNKINVTITLNANGGSITEDSNWNGSGATSTKIVYFGENYGTLPVPTKDNYKFIGWYKDLNDNTKITESSKVDEKTNHTLYAKWEGKKYLLTLDANGGTLTNSSWEMYGNEKFESTNISYSLLQDNNINDTYTCCQTQKPDAVDGNYEITGKTELISSLTSDNYYCTSKVTDISGDCHFKELKEIYKIGQVVTSSSDSIKYSAIKYYQSITECSNATKCQKEIVYGTEYSILPQPTLDGSTFDGWYTKLDSTDQIDEGNFDSITKNTTLYAKWK